MQGLGSKAPPQENVLVRRSFWVVSKFISRKTLTIELRKGACDRRKPSPGNFESCPYKN